MRLDQTLPFTVTWDDGAGGPVPTPSGIVASVSDPTKGSVSVNADGSFTFHPLAQTPGVTVQITGVGVTLPASGGINVTAPLPPTVRGTIHFGTATPP